MAAALLMIPGILPTRVAAQDARWSDIQASARGQTVYFNAWAGDEAINRYIAWTAAEVRHRYGITLVHVKIADIAEAVTRILAERAAGKLRNGSADLLWINGENFASLKRAGLLWGPWTQKVPNSQLIDAIGNPTTQIDFTLPTGGFELSWGTARFTLFYESMAVPLPPRDPAGLLTWIQSHPGRFTYPRPPDFIGSSFLKQLLVLLVADRDRLARPVGADFAAVTVPLWRWLDLARPHLWRRGHLYPASGPAMRELLAAGELDWAFAFNPSEASRAIRRGELPGSVRGSQFSGGALANSHFMAIPFNARSPAAAMVVANFLLSPCAQIRKADEAVWGDPTVLSRAALSAADRDHLDALDRGPATPPDGTVVLEPHGSWTTALQQEWTRRYGVE
jgi:putative thiamine transport system substrate-binding protein